MNAFTEQETAPDPATALAIDWVPLCSGRGQFHSNEPTAKTKTPYTTLTWTAIKEMVDKPQAVDKARAQWLIPSAVLSRNFKQQEVEGRYWLLWADIDHNPDGLDKVAAAVGLITGDAGFDFEVYTSRSATESNVKCRVLIPMAAPLSGNDWILAQEVFNDAMEVQGIAPDRASERTGQLLYLPNRGDLYRNLSYRDGRFFDPMTEWAEAIEAKQRALVQAETEAIARQAAAKARRATLQLGQYGSAIAAFNSVYSAEEILLSNGYAQRGNSYRHPKSESGSYSASVQDGRVHSLSSADPLYTKGGGVGAHDAFSAFTVLEHGGDQKAAHREACDRMLVIDGESWTAASRKAHAQEKPQAPPPEPESKEQTGNTEPHKQDAYIHPMAMFIDAMGEVTPPNWLIPGFLADGVTVIAGTHGVGKSTSLVPLCLTIAGIAGHPELRPRQWRHVCFCTEDAGQIKRILAGIVGFGGFGINAETVRERFHLVEAKRLNPAFVAEVAPTYREMFSRTIDGVEVPPLTIFDTKSACFAAEDENSNSESSLLMATLKQNFGGMSVWLITHVAKASRNDTSGLTARGASALEADANCTAFLTAEGDKKRYLVLGKRRFEPRWPELVFESHLATVPAKDAWGNVEMVPLRWSTAAPPETSRTEAKEQAADDARRDEADAVRCEILDAVQTAWAVGEPLSRRGVRGKVRRNVAAVNDMVELLVCESWLVEVTVPTKERTNNRRSSFLVALITPERMVYMESGKLPDAKQVIPASWKKAPIPLVPEPESTSEENDATEEDISH